VTQIRFRFRRPDASHVSGVPVDGTISCNPTTRVVQEDESLLLPMPFAVRLPSDGEDLTIDLKPTGADWCWRIAERILRHAGHEHRRGCGRMNTVTQQCVAPLL
jgi:hypothetical protein